MLKKTAALGIAGAAALALLIVLPSASAEEKQRGFIGVAGCKKCHKTAKQGEQFKLWSEGPHAKAYATLASDDAKAIAKEKGIADAQKADQCLKCHVTGHGAAAELLGAKYLATDGVGCESCHGGGADYYKKKTMVAITKGELDGATVGLIKPTEKTCTGCHNDQSPTFEGFDFEKMVAKIAHPVPEARKAKYAEGGEDKEDDQ